MSIIRIRNWFRELQVVSLYKRLTRRLASFMPKGLYARSLIIVIAPIVILQSVFVFVFMERHWELVMVRLSAALSQDVAALIAIYETYPDDRLYTNLTKIAKERMNLDVLILPSGPLPEVSYKPFFTQLDDTLTEELSKRIEYPFIIDTIGRSKTVEIRIRLNGAVMQIFALRTNTYESRSHIFVLWMLGSSIVLLIIAVSFLRNQIKPIQSLAASARAFGMGGRSTHTLKLRGATEVREASLAFMEMQNRIERQISQRTVMLAGVSHDLRTLLARFKLELAMLAPDEDTEALRQDVDEMQRMLEDYIAFAKGTSGEMPEMVDLAELIRTVCASFNMDENNFSITVDGITDMQLRPNSMKRCIDNLVSNSLRYATHLHFILRGLKEQLVIYIDDDGPGIAENEREDVLKPFFKLDDARNLDDPGTGLGLAIARDIVMVHGGEFSLHTSPMGGLRVKIQLPR